MHIWSPLLCPPAPHKSSRAQMARCHGTRDYPQFAVRHHHRRPECVDKCAHLIWRYLRAYFNRSPHPIMHLGSVIPSPHLDSTRLSRTLNTPMIETSAAVWPSSEKFSFKKSCWCTGWKEAAPPTCRDHCLTSPPRLTAEERISPHF